MAEPIEIQVWQGEIAELEVDGIVIPASESLFMTSPVAAAVKRAAGDDVERAAVARGPLAPGQSLVTPGGRLPSPYVIHAVAVGHERRADADRLAAAVESALALAEHLGMQRVAMAPLGAERGVFAPAEAAGTILQAIAARATRGDRLPASLVFAVGVAEAPAFRAAVEAHARVPARHQLEDSR
jgi:O-acetyl-ADP-ribose deacetylase (regulator of RNase III)